LPPIRVIECCAVTGSGSFQINSQLFIFRNFNGFEKLSRLGDSVQAAGSLRWWFSIAVPACIMVLSLWIVFAKTQLIVFHISAANWPQGCCYPACQ